MIRNSTVPTPENSSVVVGGKPVSTGTRNVAPNIATTCWAPMPMVRGQLSRSSGATTAASGGTGVQVRFHLAGLILWNYTIGGPLATLSTVRDSSTDCRWSHYSNTCAN